MTSIQLEQVIRDYIRDIYNKEYIGKIKIIPLEPVGYSIHLSLGINERPLVIHAELEDEMFLKFLKNDLRTRNFHLADFGELNLYYPTSCRQINSSCNCYEKR